MATIIIPVTNEPESTATYSLEGVNYGFRFRYNERAGAWFFDLSTDAGVPLVTGHKVVVSAFLFGWRETSADMPPGALFAYDTSDQRLDPTLEDFGTRVILTYVESVA